MSNFYVILTRKDSVFLYTLALFKFKVIINHFDWPLKDIKISYYQRLAELSTHTTIGYLIGF